MLCLSGGQVESLWDEVLPGEVRELPEDLGVLDGLLSDQELLAPIAAHWPVGGCFSWAPDNLDGELCAVDGGQGTHGLGLRDACAGGIGLAASAPVLFDRAGRARAARVDGAQAHAPAGRGGRGGADALRDREGAARDALQSEGCEDRLDGGGGRCALSQRRGVEPGRRAWRARRAG